MTHFRLHIGAHKTATTHLQNLLAACGPELARGGVGFLPHEAARQLLGEAMSRRNWRRMLGNRALAGQIVRAMCGRFPDAQSIVLSEENILGGAGELLADPIYPRLERRLQLLQALAEQEQTTVFLSIRPFDQILPGAYATGLKHGSVEPAMAQAMRDACDNRASPSWIDLIERIRQMVPSAELKIWRYEDYIFDRREIVSAVTGVQIGSLPDLPRPKRTQTPSGEGVAMAEAFLAAGRVTHRAQKIGRIYDDHPVMTGADKFTLFCPSQSQRLQQQYREDIDAIRRRWPGELIETARQDSNEISEVV